MRRTNTAKWLDAYNRWQIKVQKNGERRIDFFLSFAVANKCSIISVIFFPPKKGRDFFLFFYRSAKYFGHVKREAGQGTGCCCHARGEDIGRTERSGFQRENLYSFFQRAD